MIDQQNVRDALAAATQPRVWDAAGDARSFRAAHAGILRAEIASSSAPAD